MTTSKYIILAGIIIVAIGILLYFFPNAFRWLGRLPGDIRVEKGNTSFYFPVVTMIIISIAGSILLYIVRKYL